MEILRFLLHAIHTACGIETATGEIAQSTSRKLHAIHTACGIETCALYGNAYHFLDCMQSIPLAVLKPCRSERFLESVQIACNPYRLRY